MGNMEQAFREEEKMRARDIESLNKKKTKDDSCDLSLCIHYHNIAQAFENDSLNPKAYHQNF